MMGLVLPLALLSTFNLHSGAHAQQGVMPVIPLDELVDAAPPYESAPQPAVAMDFAKRDDDDVIPQRSYRSFWMNKKSELPVALKLGKNFFNKVRRETSDGSSIGLSNLVKDWAGRNQWSRRRHYISKKSHYEDQNEI